MLIGSDRSMQNVFELSEKDRNADLWCHEPRLLKPRPREPVIPSRLDLTKETGVLVLADVYHGRNMSGVRRGEIKKLLVLETLPKAVNFSGQADPYSFDHSFNLNRFSAPCRWKLRVGTRGSAGYAASSWRHSTRTDVPSNGCRAS